MAELEREEAIEAERANRPAKSYRMFFSRDARLANIHPGRLNLPISNEVAAVFVDDDGRPPENVGVCVYPRHEHGQGRHYINYLDPTCDPICYPLLFPNGETGIYLYLFKLIYKNLIVFLLLKDGTSICDMLEPTVPVRDLHF